MNYVFPVPEGVVTTGFWDLRPYSKPVSERTYIHRAWDIAHRGNPQQNIVAPEDGKVVYQVHMRCPLTKSFWAKWPDSGGDYLFSNWFADSMGGVIVFMGRSGYLYAFGHVDIDIVFHMIERYHIPYEWVRKANAYNDYIRYVNTFGHPKTVLAGETLGYIGNAGYSTGYHTHMQVHTNRYYDSRIDPAELWPHQRIFDNGAGPKYGVREGADHIPPVQMDLSYMRGE